MSVFLRRQKLKNGLHLSFVESFYDKKTKNSIQKTIKNIGYVKELQKTYQNPIAYFDAEAKKLSIESSKKYSESKARKIPREGSLKNIGYFLPRYVYNKFNFRNISSAITYDRRFKFDLESIFKFLVFSQIVHPAAKQKEYKEKEQFLENFDFSDDQMYDAIQCIGENEEKIKEYIALQTKDIIKLNTSKSYFDGTNIYFEIDKETEEQKRGPEKNNRHDPIIGLGLLMDGNGYPINYTIFPGNQSEQPELHKNVQALKKKNCIVGKTIITADKGLNSGDNMYKAVQNGDGYVMGQKVRRASKDTIDWVLQDNEYSKYTKNYDNNGILTYKIKSEIGEYDVTITSPLNNQKTKIKLKQKRVIFWSKDYADKAKFERGKLIVKAKEIINNPSSFLKSYVGDAASYIKEINYDNEGRIIENSNLILDEDAIKKAEVLDGFYMIVTSETDLPDEEIIKIYRGLWEIEETFSIIKGVLKVRPIFSKTKEGIHAHILVCFLSLLILRILQKDVLLKELDSKQINAIEEANKRKKKHKISYQKRLEYPIKQISSFIQNFEAVQVDEKFHLVKYIELIPFIEERFSISLDRWVLTIDDIKNIFKATPQHKTKIIN